MIIVRKKGPAPLSEAQVKEWLLGKIDRAKKQEKRESVQAARLALGQIFDIDAEEMRRIDRCAVIDGTRRV